MPMLLADIGGTNTRCATMLPGQDPARVRRYRNRDFDGLPALLAAYLDECTDEQRPDSAALAVAGPVQGSQVQMLNIDWAFDSATLCDALSLSKVTLINDFAALAHALPILGADDLAAAGGGPAQPLGNRVVLGPGTGLGVAGLVYGHSAWHAVCGEGGHVTLAASDARETELIAETTRRYGHCSAERLISGPGLALIHEFLHGESVTDAAELGARVAGGDQRARASLELQFELLGSVAGDLALTFGAFGGVYIGGGIVPRYLDLFLKSGFRRRFEAKGRYTRYLADIPVSVVTAPYAALTGLAAWTAQES
jgi:glucokinase